MQLRVGSKDQSRAPNSRYHFQTCQKLLSACIIDVYWHTHIGRRFEFWVCVASCVCHIRCVQVQQALVVTQVGVQQSIPHQVKRPRQGLSGSVEIQDEVTGQMNRVHDICPRHLHLHHHAPHEHTYVWCDTHQPLTFHNLHTAKHHRKYNYYHQLKTSYNTCLVGRAYRWLDGNRQHRGKHLSSSLN